MKNEELEANAVKDSPKNRKLCICPDCPSLPVDCKKEILYCARGKSNCEIAANGCICDSCEVYEQNKLTGLYYCNRVEIGFAENRILMRKQKEGEPASVYETIKDIKEIAESGKSIVRSMGSQKMLPFSFADLHFIPAQVANIPLNREEAINTEVVIGPRADKPLHISTPIMISGMSYGATSKNVKIVISTAANRLHTAYSSGEGGILPEELSHAAENLIGQYGTARFGLTDELLKKLAAIEIRFGQGAYPGKGSYLPGNKITAEVARLRGLKEGEAAYSPAHHPDMNRPEEIRAKVSWLRKLTGGIPIGAKIGCGNIEKDLAVLVEAGVDFIALDGFGGGTGATDIYVRDNVGLPLVAALPRAYNFLRRSGVKDRISLIAGGGLRTSADFAKCLALGADAVYIGTAALIAINCEQYRICHTGLCPTGVTTHLPSLTKQIDVAKGIEKLTNFIRVSTEEVAGLTRIVGKKDVKKLNCDDLISLKQNLAIVTGTGWIDGRKYQSQR